MKKTKKFEDGGPTGGRYVDMGDSRVFVPDTPAPVADRPDVVARPMGAGLAGQNGPMAEAQLAGLGGVAGGMGMLSGMDRPDVTARPMGLMLPRGRGLGASLAGMGALQASGMKKGGTVKKMAKGGTVSSASKRADGCAVKGKTKGRFV
jgi:hypothetical protein